MRIMADRPGPHGNINSYNILDIQKKKHVLTRTCFFFCVQKIGTIF
jgi:hypothetical protein